MLAMRRYLVFATCTLALVLSSVASTSAAVAFPEMSQALGSSLVFTSWVIGAYQLVGAGILPLAGKAGDVLGRKPVFMLSMGLFTAGSLFSAVSPNIGFLILSRLIQGMGAGGLMPAAFGVVADEFPRARQQAIGLITTTLPIGMILGPNLGGWLVTALGWRSVFWLNVPLGLAGLAALWLLLKDSRREAGRLDVVGAALFTGSLFAFMGGFSGLGNGVASFSVAMAAVLFAVSAAIMVVFLRRARRVANPVIELEILTGRPYLAANVYNFLFGVCAFGVVSLVPLYAVSVYGSSTLESGLIMTPRSVGMILASGVTSVLLVRWGYRWPMLVGSVVMIVSMVLLGLEPGRGAAGGASGNTWWLLGAMLISGLGTGIAAPASNNACIELMPERVSTITAIRAMFRQAGGAVSVTAGSLLLHVAGNIASGFVYLYLGISVIMVMMIPALFLMPRSPVVRPKPAKEQGTAGAQSGA